MLANFQTSVTSGAGDPNYNPDVFEYDEEQPYGEEGERVILD
jgi:hypothetical protein